MAADNVNEPYWYNASLPLAKGCEKCTDLNVCGGLRVASEVESCLEYCSCNSHGGDYRGTVCKCDVKNFVQRKREVGGWELEVPRAETAQYPELPTFIPMIYDRSKRSVPFVHKAVAIPLNEILSDRTGNLLVKTRDDLCKRFLIGAEVKLIISGVHYDQTLENYWSSGRREGIVRQLHDLNVDLVTTPNFSLFPDVPRWDNLHSMKRIARCWYELASADVPTALHVNARTPRDYERWAVFLNEHTEIGAISFEFQTGARSPRRGNWHVAHLQALAASISRPLALITFGGFQHIATLKQAFSSLVHISATPYMRAAHHRQLKTTNGGTRMRDAPADMSIDDLLRVNTRTYDAYIDSAGRGVA